MTLSLIDSIEAPSTTGSRIPAAIRNAQAIAAYLHGNSWPTYWPYADARPDLASKGWIVSITLTCLGKARCYDIESGGGQNKNIGIFMENADRTFGLPWLYTFASNGEDMINTAERFGYHQGKDFFYWSAHYGFDHICGPGVCQYPKADGTQNTDHVPENCDGSIINNYMLPGGQPVPPPPEETDMTSLTKNRDGRLEAFAALDSGQIKHTWQEEAGISWHGKPNVSPVFWEDLGNVGGKPKGIDSELNHNGQIEVTVQLQNGTMKHCWQMTPGGTWHGSKPGQNAYWEDFGNIN